MIFIIGGMIFLPILIIMFIFISIFGAYSIDESILEDKNNISDIGFQLPFNDNISFIITSQFGTRVDPITNVANSTHRGIDIGVPIGTEILASANGVVSVVGNSKTGLGNYVYISHIIDNKNYITVYAHLKDNSVVVEEGQIVKAKDKIGIVGNTGRVYPQPTLENPNAGTHLHFELHDTIRKTDGTTELDPTNIFIKKENN